MNPTSESTAAVSARVARALELRDDGRADWLAEACRDRPEAADEVRAAVDAADGLSPAFSEAFATDLRLGSTIAGRYHIVRRLGAGAMGVVYEAEDRTLERNVALKVLRPGLLDHERALQRFEREGRAMAAVDHSSVIEIHDRGRTDDGEAFLVMELVAGQQLGAAVDLLTDRVETAAAVEPALLGRCLGFRLPGQDGYVRVAARWVAELAAGVHVAHAAGVVHRDIKPSNVLVRRDGRAVLVDFGIAHLDESVPLTRGGTSIGTPSYMAPELLDVEQKVSPQADVYGLAAVLYCLLTLRPPYSGAPHEVLMALATRDPAPVAALHPGLPRDLVAIVEKGMSRRPSERYASAADLERDLRAFLDHRPVVARPIGPLRRTWRRARRSRAAQGAALALGLVVLATSGAGLRAQWLAGREARWLELSRHFPPNFTILNFENREYLHETDRADVERLLDDAAAVCVDPLPTLVLRASFRFDHGDLAGAADDMQRVARHEGTPLARALAAAYASVDLEAARTAGSRALDLDALPGPEGPRDAYLRFYHHVRDFEDPAALALLDDEVTAAVPHAETLRFALVDVQSLEPIERRRAAFALHSDVRDHEARIGVRTATSAHFASNALAHANEFESALDAGLESVALAPRTHVNRANAGWAAFALGRHEEARALLAVALEVRPNDLKLDQTIVWSFIAEGDFDGGLAYVDGRDAVVTALVPWWAHELRGIVETYRALAQPRAETPGAVAAARGHFERAAAAGASAPPSFAVDVLDALEAGDDQALAAALADQAADEPRRLWRLRILRRELPAQLDGAATAAFADLIEAFEREIVGARLDPNTER